MKALDSSHKAHAFGILRPNGKHLLIQAASKKCTKDLPKAKSQKMYVPPMIYVLLIVLVLKIGLMLCLCGVDMFSNYSSSGSSSSKSKKNQDDENEMQRIQAENALNAFTDQHKESFENEVNEKLERSGQKFIVT